MKCHSYSKVNDNNVYHSKETAVIPNISDSELRARIYREAMLDAENENKRLREENESLKKAAQFYERAYADTSAQNFLLSERNKRLMTESDIHCEEAGRQMKYAIHLKEENERLKGENAMLDKMVSGNGMHLIKLTKRIDDAIAILNPKFD